MNATLEIMDEQMLLWIKELDALYKGKETTNKTIQQLEQRIASARELREALETKHG